MRVVRLLCIGALLCAACNLVSGASDLVTGEANADADAGPVGAADATTDTTQIIQEDGAVNPIEDLDADPPREEIPDGASDSSVPPLGKSQDGGYLRVFLTASTIGGSMGGTAGGDTLCNAAAVDGGLGGTWHAWLATNAVPAGSRVAGNGPWLLLDGTKVANGRLQLLSGLLTTKIDRTERNVKLVGHIHVWTGAMTDGTAFPDTCGGWTLNAAGTRGEVGYNTTGPGWTDHNSNACTSSLPLYCFEQ